MQTRVDAAGGWQYTERTAQDENVLNLLAGSPVPADTVPKALSLVKPLPDVFPGMSSEVLLRRPDILQAEHVLKGANANIGAARAVFPHLPDHRPGKRSGDLSGLFQSGSAVWNYAPRIVLPIFDARTWSAQSQEVDKEIALTQYEKAIQSAFREVADALAKRGTIGDQLAAQQSRWTPALKPISSPGTL